MELNKTRWWGKNLYWFKFRSLEKSETYKEGYKKDKVISP
jgi:hypothetical protein